MDSIESPVDIRDPDPDILDLVDKENDLLDQLPLPGNPTGEQQRKAKWLALPRRARLAVRRLHRHFSHLPKNALVQLLRSANAPKEYVDAARSYRCPPCEQTRPQPPTRKVAPPRPYTFNHEVGVDVITVRDTVGKYFDIIALIMVLLFNKPL